MGETDPKHERAVEEFMKAAREQDPARVAELEERYPVLTEAQLERARKREVGFTERSIETGVLTAKAGRPPIPLMADIFGRRIFAFVDTKRGAVATFRPAATRFCA